MTLRNAFDGLAEEPTLQDVLHILAMILRKMPEVDVSRGLVSAVVTSAPTTAVTLTSTTANQGTAGTAAWPVQIAGTSGLDQHYQSQQAFAYVRDRITVT